MVGGVWEWVEDWFSLHYYQSSPLKNPKGPARTSFRVIRGNSWMSDDQHVRVTARHGGMSDPTLSYWVGVRSEEHTSELQSRTNLVCRLLLEKKKQTTEHNKTSQNIEIGRAQPTNITA